MFAVHLRSVSTASGLPLLCWTHVAILTAEVVNHHTVWIPGKGTGHGEDTENIKYKTISSNSPSIILSTKRAQLYGFLRLGFGHCVFSGFIKNILICVSKVNILMG